MDPDIFRDLMWSLAGISFGSALYMGIEHLFYMKRDKGQGQTSMHLGCAFIVVAWLIAVGSIIAIFARSTDVTPTWRGYLYLFGLAVGSAGFILVANATRKKG